MSFFNFNNPDSNFSWVSPNWRSFNVLYLITKNKMGISDFRGIRRPVIRGLNEKMRARGEGRKLVNEVKKHGSLQWYEEVETDSHTICTLVMSARGRAQRVTLIPT